MNLNKFSIALLQRAIPNQILLWAPKRVVPALTPLWSEPRTAFHFLLQVCCGVGADSEDSIVILTAHKRLLPAAITRIRHWQAFTRRCPRTQTQKYERSWTRSKLEIQLKVCLEDLHSCTPSSWQLEVLCGRESVCQCVRRVMCARVRMISCEWLSLLLYRSLSHHRRTVTLTWPCFPSKRHPSDMHARAHTHTHKHTHRC